MAATVQQAVQLHNQLVLVVRQIVQLQHTQMLLGQLMLPGVLIRLLLLQNFDGHHFLSSFATKADVIYCSPILPNPPCKNFPMGKNWSTWRKRMIFGRALS